MKKTIRVLIVGCGHMGTSHALAYHRSPDFEVVGLVSRGERSRAQLSALLGGAYPTFDNYARALAQTNPDAVCISTYPDTHAAYAKTALEAGCHVFLEKPLATTLDDAIALVRLSRQKGKKLMVGYILQQHPSWNRFVKEAQSLGKPLVMRMNLNQQSSASEWRTHQAIMQSMDPITDCGVHYIDVMCRMTGARPVAVNAISARLCDDLPPGRSNYGQLQLFFEDGSVGWYEAAWGPMVSQTAFFVKDVMGPLGSVSIAGAPTEEESSDNVNAHTKTEALLVHHAALDGEGNFRDEDTLIRTDDEPDHDELCAREQAYFALSIREDFDLCAHLSSALYSLQVVLAAESAARSRKTVPLEPLALSDILHP